MIKYRDLLQNSRAFSLFKRDLQENMLSHAYMFVSEDTIAMEEFYKLLLMAIYCGDNMCEKCATCDKILNKNHADIIHIDKEKTIQVEDIKTIVEQSFVSSVEGGKKVFVIHQGDKMNTQAQNKLLKILEEPPKDVVIIIGVANLNTILATVKSRVKKIYLDLFDSDKIYEEIKGFSEDNEKAKIASICSEGMVGKAEQLLYDDKYLALFDKTIKLLFNLTHSSQIIDFIGDDMFSKENISNTLDILMLLMRDIAVVSKDSNLVISKHRLGDIIKLSKSFNVASAVGICDNIEKMKRMLYYNINSANVAEQLLFAILEVKFRCRQ